MSEHPPKTMICHDCGIDVWDAGEYVLLANGTWGRTGMDATGCLCVKCTEHRLGRKLRGDDIKVLPKHNPTPYLVELAKTSPYLHPELSPHLRRR